MIITGTGLPPNTNLVLEWSTYNATWDVAVIGAVTPTSVPQILGINTAPWELVLGNVVTNATGAFSRTVAVPVDNCGSHVIEVVAPGAKTADAEATFTSLPSFSFSPTSGPVGTPVTVYATGMGAKLYASAYHVLFDNEYLGYMTGITTRGSGNFTFYVTGTMGIHTISVYNGYPGPAYLNSQEGSAVGSVTSWDPPLIPFHGQFNITGAGPLTFTPQAAVVRPEITPKDTTPTSGARITVTPNVATVGTVVNVTGLGFPPNTLTPLSWATHVGNHLSGFNSSIDPLRSVMTSAAGSFSFSMKVPYELGGPHNITASAVAPNGNATLYIERSASINATQGPEGSQIVVSMTGLGWTYQDNIAAVDYDNSFIGYVCGFNTQGNITLYLTVTGQPGYHTIDLYPANYLGPTAPLTPSIAVYRYPILTVGDDPYQLPMFHFSFQITGPSTSADSQNTATVTSTAPGVTITSTVPGPTVTSTAPGVTITSTVPGPTITSTPPGTTSTTTATTTAASTAVQTTSTVPTWTYGVMAVLLMAGFAMGYVVKRRP